MRQTGTTSRSRTAQARGGDRDRGVWRGERTEQRRIRVCGCNLHDPLCGHLMSIVHLYVIYDMICIQRCLVQTNLRMITCRIHWEAVAMMWTWTVKGSITISHKHNTAQKSKADLYHFGKILSKKIFNIRVNSQRFQCNPENSTNTN